MQTFVVLKSQQKEKPQDSKKSKNLAVLTKHQTQLVIVIVLNGQKVKPSHMYLPLLLMRDNGLKALHKLGRLQQKTATSTLKHLSMKQIKRTNMNATS